MGFLDIDNNSGLFNNKGTLDLVEFENKLIEKFNSPEILSIKYKAEELGVAFNKKSLSPEVYKYENELITLCPEPLEFIKEFDEVSDNSNESNILFMKKIKEFQTLMLSEKPFLNDGLNEQKMWVNKTLTGINLRLGNLDDDRDDFKPVKMCDDNVHGLVVGRTGSGKSVFINALLLSLITEYAPWELNLFLIDFKKVELSRYMNNADSFNKNIAFTPHINACAATSEVRYVISLIKYIVDCMNARNEFFARLGVTKIQEFREKYNLVLPRVLLVVDEFQQMFIEATSREKDEIQSMLNSITKLGRATGFHLLFASQDMSGTLRGNTLANFKIRMALPCTPQISSEILGNSHAANLERGYVLINTDSGDELSNKKYRVPFIETDNKDEEGETKTPFYTYLDKIKLSAVPYTMKKFDEQKFYREELQEKEKDYIQDLNKIQYKKNKLVSQNKSIYDGIVLGKTVLYSTKKNDKVSFYIERGRNKGIMIATPNPDDAARIRKLISENLLRSSTPTTHIGLELNNLIFEKYNIKSNADKYPLHSYYKYGAEDGIQCLQWMYFLRKSAFEYLSNNKEDEFKRVSKLEEHLKTQLSDKKLLSEYESYKTNRANIEGNIAILKQEINNIKNLSINAIKNPIVKFINQCSAEIVIIPKYGTKASLFDLKLYKTIINNFNVSIDVVSAAEKNVALIDDKLSHLGTLDGLAILQYRVLKRAILYYVSRYEDEEPESTSLSSELDRCYLTVEQEVVLFKKEYQQIRDAENNIINKNTELNKLQFKLDELLLNPNKILSTEEKIKDYLTGFINSIYDAATRAMKVKNNPKNLQINYEYKEGELFWRIDREEPPIVVCLNNILNLYINSCRKECFERFTFDKVVVWINGLDEIDKIQTSIVDIFRNAINLNILIVAIITSELKDSTVRKAFDYSFVTGNIEKFYTMFDIRYTKQAFDSIVVNFGIRSKGLSIPFKIYKSDLDEISTPNFIEQLLNC